MAPDLDEYLALFTEDAVWERADYETLGVPGPHVGGKLVGRAAIEADRKKVRADGHQGPGSRKWHVNTTLAVKVNDNGTASAQSYWLFVGSKETPPRVLSIGTYRDSFRRTE